MGVEDMKVLIACEFSGTVRDAFIRHGHDAWSCDVLPTEVDGPHIQGDVIPHLSDGWDLMIAHPPCTHLAVSGARYFAQKRADGRQQAALEFVQQLLDAPIDRIALENPVSIISSQIRKPDQIIQPFEYGHPESKKTCLWLKNLERLSPTDILPTPDGGKWSNQTPSGQNKLAPSPDRWKKRSMTYQNIAEAMAAQWGI
jgi:site-specific DNA-cytosine methylase